MSRQNKKLIVLLILISIGILSHLFCVRELFRFRSEFTRGSDQLILAKDGFEVSLTLKILFRRQKDKTMIDAFVDDVQFSKIEQQNYSAAFIAAKFDRAHCTRRETKLNLIKDRPYIVTILPSA